MLTLLFFVFTVVLAVVGAELVRGTCRRHLAAPMSVRPTAEASPVE